MAKGATFKKRWGLLDLIYEEFRMYEHHDDATGRPMNGLVRPMIHSLCQQLVGSDLWLWMMHAALREDHATRLVVYPTSAIDDVLFGSDRDPLRPDPTRSLSKSLTKASLCAHVRQDEDLKYKNLSEVH